MVIFVVFWWPLCCLLSSNFTVQSRCFEGFMRNNRLFKTRVDFFGVQHVHNVHINYNIKALKQNYPTKPLFFIWFDTFLYKCRWDVTNLTITLLLQEDDVETSFGKVHCTMKGVPRGNRPTILTFHDIGLNRKSLLYTSPLMQELCLEDFSARGSKEYA